MSTPLERLAELGLELPRPPRPAAAYRPWVRHGELILTAGQIPVVDGTLRVTGRAGADVDLETATAQARTAGLNVLAVVADAAGGLDGVRCLKLTVFVASAPGFTDQHLVANGASDLIAHVLGDAGAHARSAVGVASLPLGAVVEVEGVFAVGAAPTGR